MRYRPALDVLHHIEATSGLPGQWSALTNVFDLVPGADGRTERVTIRDQEAATNHQRFFLLRLKLR